jgi:hypothetical protein
MSARVVRPPPAEPTLLNLDYLPVIAEGESAINGDY